MTLKQIITSKIFLLGLLIRFAVMPFTGHYDIRGINFAVYNLPFKGITNVYDVAATGPIDYLVNVNFGRDYFIYPPLNYFTLGSFMTILKPLYGQEFANWIEGYGNDTLSVVTHPHVGSFANSLASESICWISVKRVTPGSHGLVPASALDQ